MDVIDWVLIYIYSLAHILGKFFLDILNMIFNFTPFPIQLIDPIGFLIILTVFAMVVLLSRKVAKWILIISWIFIFFKITLIIYKG